MTRSLFLSSAAPVLAASVVITVPAAAGECGDPGCIANIEDSDGASIVDGTDLGLLLSEWGARGACSNLDDQDGLRITNGADLGVLLAAWGACPSGSACAMADHDCCVAGGPGCTDTECCETLCDLDPFCCEIAWDSVCVLAAGELCVRCAFPCPPSDHDCCSEGVPGCTWLACCGLVCTADPFCCETWWDSLCVNIALTECAECP